MLKNSVVFLRHGDAGIFLIIGAIVMALGSLRASRKMHDSMLENILQSPMSFFDTTPVGRINNRFGKDLDTMDILIPRSTISALNNLFLVNILFFIAGLYISHPNHSTKHQCSLIIISTERYYLNIFDLKD
jgi:ABC-type multidrug transport system fused ATPase/permease subunit